MSDTTHPETTLPEGPASGEEKADPRRARLYGIRVALEEWNMAEDTYRDIRYLAEGTEAEEVVWTGSSGEACFELAGEIQAHAADLAGTWGYPGKVPQRQPDEEGIEYAVWVETHVGEPGREGVEAFDLEWGQAYHDDGAFGAVLRTSSKGTATTFAAVVHRHSRELSEQWSQWRETRSEARHGGSATPR